MFPRIISLGEEIFSEYYLYEVLGKILGNQLVAENNYFDAAKI